MNWFLIPKVLASPSQQTTYQGWKAELAAEARHQCVYCSVHESAFGGTRNFHVEHLRPKSRFPHLELVYANLFYACAVCNSFKLDDWPRDDNNDTSNACYPDPSVVDFTSLFRVMASSKIVGTCVAARYLEHRLHLNRPQLLVYRRSHRIQQRIRAVTTQLEALLAKQLGTRETKRIGGLLAKIVRALVRLNHARPYTASQLR